MAKGKVLICSCRSEFQDQIYGQNNRYCNMKGDGKRTESGYRCTVCGKDVSGNSSKKVVIKTEGSD